MKAKGVIFDFNGTLFFDSDKHEKAWKKFSKEVRSYPFSEEEILTRVHGRTNRSILEYLLQTEVSDELLKEYITKKEQYYQQSCLEDPANLKLVDGTIQFFEFLNKRGIAKTIATSAEITNLNFFNEQFGLHRWFELEKIIYDDNQTRGKPAPDMFLKAATAIEQSPSECVVFEDSESGVVAARNAGIGKIIIVDPNPQKSAFHGHPDVELVIPDFLGLNTSRLF